MCEQDRYEENVTTTQSENLPSFLMTDGAYRVRLCSAFDASCLRELRTHAHVNTLHIHTHIHAYTHSHMHMQTHTNTHTPHAHICTLTHTHTCTIKTHTFTPTHKQMHTPTHSHPDVNKSATYPSEAACASPDVGSGARCTQGTVPHGRTPASKRCCGHQQQSSLLP